MKATDLGNFTSWDHQVCYPRSTRDFSLDRKASFSLLNTIERYHTQGLPSSFLAAFSLLTWNLPHFLAVAVAILAGACQSRSQHGESRRPLSETQSRLSWASGVSAMKIVMQTFGFL